MKKFTKKIEDFICANCGASVAGNGYTNHCPICLWSADVDINPGDRLSQCGGLMRPISIEMEKNKIVITHKCEKCGKQKRQQTAGGDNMDAVIALSLNRDFIFGK